MTITVTDENETPEFPSTETGDRQVAENTVAGEDIGAAVAAIDPDAGDTLTYTLGGPDAASFGIIATSGQLQTKAALDYEDKASYEVTVSAHDGKDASGDANPATDDTITVTITVTNIDEPGTVTLSSAQPRVYAAFTATLTDPDGSISDVTWQWSEFLGWVDLLDRNRRRNGSDLHTGGRLRGQLSAGHGVLHRRRGSRQERPGGIGPRSAASFGIIATSGQLQTKAPLASKQQGAGVPVQRDRRPASAREHGCGNQHRQRLHTGGRSRPLTATP